MNPLRRAVAGLMTFVVAGSLLACSDASRGPTDPDGSVVPLLSPSASSAATFTSNEQVPFSTFAFVSCANGGAGELVFVSGTLHILTHQTVSNSGNIHFKTHFQPQGVSGEGLTTGDSYRATGVTQTQTNLNGPLPITQTFINNFRIIGQGPDNNFLVHQNVHITINANGVVTSTVENTSVECR